METRAITTCNRSCKKRVQFNRSWETVRNTKNDIKQQNLWEKTKTVRQTDFFVNFMQIFETKWSFVIISEFPFEY